MLRRFKDAPPNTSFEREMEMRRERDGGDKKENMRLLNTVKIWKMREKVGCHRQEERRANKLASQNLK